MPRSLATVALLAALPACDTPPEGTWVARLSGADAWVGITVEGERAAAFVCGGETALDTHTRWMLASADADEVTFEEGGFRLDVSLSDERAEGALLEPDGTALSFDARRVDEGGVAGLYFGFDSGCGDGLIVLSGANPDAPEALGAWCDSDGLRAQVTPVLPIERTAAGVAAFVELTSGRRDFFMTPVVPATVTP